MLVTSIPQYIQGLTNAKVDLTTTDATVLYTAPSGADFNASVVSSIIVSEDSGNADTLTLTITNGSDVFSLFKVKAVGANGTVELLTRDLVLQSGEILNNLHTEYAEFKKGDDIFSLENKNIILKIDAEGHEKEVIQGLENNLNKNSILLQIEIFDKNFDVMNNILKDKNFNQIHMIKSDGKKDYYYKNY